LLWAFHGEEEIPGTGFSDLGGREPAALIEIAESKDIFGFKADVKEADGVGGLEPGIELDELTVVDLDEGLGGDSVFFDDESFLKAELCIESAGGVEIGDTNGDVS
jgi:hypothetical protein